MDIVNTIFASPESFLKLIVLPLLGVFMIWHLVMAIVDCANGDGDYGPHY